MESSLMIGRTITHFEILEKLGEGGMGVVYKARDTNLDRLVAIKVLPADRLADVDRRRRFIQEAKAASALNHPNIVTIHEISRSDGLDYIVMEYVPGKTLDQLISRRGIRLVEALKYAVQIADGLSKAHSAGIVHRDLKPSNVIVSNDGRLKIVDFGLAKLTEPHTPGPGEGGETLTAPDILTEEGTIVGTVAYMSPEQAEARQVDHRSDIFSFGSVLYEMLTGQRAFQGSTKMATLAAVIREDPKPMSEVAHTLPMEIEKLISRCMRKDPDRRVQHMVDVKLALEELKEESESGSQIVGKQPPTARGRMKLWAFAVGLLTVLVGAAYWVQGRGESNPSAFKTVVLTSYPVFEPALSPDGKQIAFSWRGEKNDNWDIYVKLVDAGTPVRITKDPAVDRRPVWSPDARFLGFIRSNRRVGSKDEIYVVPSLGGQERRIIELPLPPSHATSQDIDWTPDGKSLIFTNTMVDPPSLAMVNIETAQLVRLTSLPPKSYGDYHARISPDGKSLAFLRLHATSVFDFERIDFPPKPGDEPVRVIKGVRNRQTPIAWTADSQEWIVSDTFDGVDTLARVSIREKNPIPRLLAGIGNGSTAPTISRSGGRLAYSYRFSDSNIWKAALMAAVPTEQRIIASTRSESQPDYSADGGKIAFISDQSGESQVWTADADGSGQRQVTNGVRLPNAPRWSPDGSKIAFAARPGGNVDVYVVDAQGGAPRRMTTHPDEDASARWSRDGKWIYFASNRTGRRDVWRIPADGSGPETQVTKRGGWVSRESVDGKILYYAKLDIPGLWQMPLSDGEESKILDGDVFANWDIAGDYVYFLSSDGLSVQRLHMKTRKIETAARFTQRSSGGTGGLAVSADGKWVVVPRVDQAINDLKLIENFR